MTSHSWSWCWKLGLASALAVSGAILDSSRDYALAQNAIADDTLGTQVLPAGSIDIITNGTQRGANLFHSFSQFNVAPDRGAIFIDPGGIKNILSRVTGASPSQIDGFLATRQFVNGSILPSSANLFLMNPNGIVFGPNASLDVGGSFVKTTANAIEFADQGSFSTSAPNAPSVLTVNPSALLFNQIAAQPITVNSSRIVGFDNSGQPLYEGLRVPDSKSLLLLGGDVRLDGGILEALGGRVELGGVTGAGRVGLNGDGNNLSLTFPDSVERSDISLTNGAGVDVTASDGGSITVNAQNLEMTGGSFLFAGIGTGLGSENSKAGNIDVNATEVINLTNNSFIANLVQLQANGLGGNVNISGSTLKVEDGAQVSTAAFGKGKGGNLTIDAQDVQLIGASANGRVPSSLGASANSTGDAGNLMLNTKTLLVKDGAQVSTAAFGKGNGGNLTVNAQDVRLSGTGADSRFPGGLAASAQPDSTGDAGDLTLNTETLLVKDGAQVSTSTSGEGKGGNLTINAHDVQLIGESADGLLSSGLAASASLPASAGGSNLTQRNSIGDAGDLMLNTKTLLVKDGAVVSTVTSSKGKGGDLNVNAQDVQLIGTGADPQSPSSLAASAQPDSTGDAGNLTLNTKTLLVKDGANVSTGTSGEGKGGNLAVTASDFVELIGGGGLFAQTEGAGAAGDLTIDTGHLSVRDGAVVSAATIGAGDAGDLMLNTNTLLIRDGADVITSTFGKGKGGDLTVNAHNVQLIGVSADGQASQLTTSADKNSTEDAGDLTLNTNTLLVKDGAQVGAGTFGKGKGGNLTVDAQDVQLIGASVDGRVSSGLFASAESNSTGDAGDLTLNTNTLLVKDGATVTVESLGTGTAGILALNAHSIRLDDNATLTANTQSTKIDPTSEQATIKINSQELIMSSTSNISTNATGEKVIGGNITIDTDLLVALENSDITAKAEEASGGRIIINAQGIVGTEFREQLTPESDITATSDLGPEFSGIVEINTPDTELQGSLNQLSANFISPEQVVAGSCLARRNAEQGSFVVTGTGGLPRSPYEAISGRYSVTGVQPIQGSSSVSQGTKIVESPAWKKSDPIQEAQGMVVTADGRTIVGTAPQLVALAKAKNLVCHSN